MKTIIINENQQNVLIKEYLDKEYMKPLYDYLKNGQRYSDSGYLNLSKRMVVPFFDWIKRGASDEECITVGKALRNNPQLKGKLKLINGMRGWELKCYSQMSNGLQEVPPRDFLRQNQRRLFTILDHDTAIAPIFDKFMTFINSEIGRRELSRKQDLEADTALMNPEIKKPQWLIHFTDKEADALDIVKNGFKYGLGTNQMNKLAYTNRDLTKNDKKGKYAYAYNAEEIADSFFPCNLMTNDKEYWEMGNRFDQKAWEIGIKYCIMFQSSGVEAHHHTDSQQQVIFNTDMARNFVLITFKWDAENRADARNTREYQGDLQGNLTWNVCTVNGDIIYKNKSLTEAVKWVMNNFEQYRKKICFKK